MASITFQVQLGFLLAVYHNPADGVDIGHGEYPNHPYRPLSFPPTGYASLPENAKEYCYRSREHLLRAQWAIDHLEMALHASNLTTANPRRGLKVKNKLESWTVEYDVLINEDQCKEYEWFGMRLKSPLFRPETCIPGTDPKTVMDIMTKGFLAVPNAETRLVVKVFIPKLLVSLDSTKAIVSMPWLVDPLLSDIHPAEMLSAVQVEDPWDNRLSSDRKPLELLPHPGDLGDTKYRHRTHGILDATSVQDLMYLMDLAIYGEAGRCPNASPAYCFLVNKTTVVIEFRQHCRTLDMLEASLWAILCVRLTQHCLNKSGTFFYESYPNLRYWHPIASAAPPKELRAILILSSGQPFASHFQKSSRPTDRREDLQNYARKESYYFGIELELYMPVLLPHEGRPDPHPNDGRELSRAERLPNRVDLMKETISYIGPLTLVWDEHFDRKSRESKLLSHGMVPVDDIDPQYQTWTIGTDVSLRRMSEWGGYKQLNGLEIISRVLRATPQCWEEVLNMVSILRNNFRLTVGKSCGFHIHVSKGTGPMLLHLVRKVSILMYLAENIIYRLCCPERRESRYAPSLASLLEPLCTDQWSEMDVPADFEQYIPVHKVVDRRTLGILKKLWTTETLQLLKFLITPSMGSKSCLGLSKCHSFDEFGEGSEDECKGTVEFRYLEGTLDPELILRWSQLMVSLFQFADLASPQAWQNFVPAVLQCPALGRTDPNVLRVFLLFLGKGDDYDFWNNRMQMMTNLPLDAQQLARRPVDNNEILPPLDDEYIDTLREELCTREMKLPCTI
ncbi:uncharacterized protein FFB20_07504 [Fusarium fujikuroi]|nr:uncharacterized protein Y057_13112 [Fusarium fujikuroi]SCN85803.1 uncharacterized protein FFB20_07504 [Fusarium fujikuroi]SCN95324.1 uncharacterized protein FFC1_07285 [Fusarium fujikuroi]SCO38792.1 uncharacterized protein FFNC_06289 [Fusarium fujikuroi]